MKKNGSIEEAIQHKLDQSRGEIAHLISKMTTEQVVKSKKLYSRKDKHKKRNDDE